MCCIEEKRLDLLLFEKVLTKNKQYFDCYIFFKKIFKLIYCAIFEPSDCKAKH